MGRKAEKTLFEETPALMRIQDTSPHASSVPTGDAASRRSVQESVELAGRSCLETVRVSRDFLPAGLPSFALMRDHLRISPHFSQCRTDRGEPVENPFGGEVR